MGLSDEEFGGLTYAMFEALIERKKMSDKRMDLRAGTIASVIVNMSGRISEKTMKPADFLPDEGDREDLTKMSAEEQAAHMLSTFSKRTYSR